MEVVKAGIRAGEEVAIVGEGRFCSYSQLLSSSLHLSSLLTKGLKNSGQLEGACIGIMAKPCAEFVSGLWATWLCHGIAVPLALSHPESELLHICSDAGVSILLGTQEYEERLRNIAKKCSADVYLIPDIPSNTQIINDTKGNQERPYASVCSDVLELCSINGESCGLIVYTSGTTGRPKGAVHTHASMNSQVQILSEAWGYSKSDKFLHCLPLHHVHGLFNSLLAPMYAGAMIEFLPKFSVRGFWSKVRESYPVQGIKPSHPITVFTGVPTMYAWLLEGYKSMDEQAKKEASHAAHQLRLMMSGSSALPRTVMVEWEKITGHRLLERYGMTEFVMALSNLLHGDRRPGTVGKPLPGVEVKIVAEEESNPEVGELCVKSPSMFKEYWNQPQITRESFTEDGYFKTGDFVTKDKDGYFIILGRSSVDILKVGGYKISALEIEAVLLEIPSISECAVIGLSDEYYGESICAVVTPSEKAKADAKSGPPVTLAEVQEWAKKTLAPYKLPVQLRVWESLPRNAMGKVNKKELKKLVMEGGGAQAS